jgi:hypothetical protein
MASTSTRPADCPFFWSPSERSPPLEVFASLEAMEFGGSLERARAEYQALAGDRNPSVQAGGLLRLGRVQRRTKDFAGALITYQRLVQLGAVDSGDLPAELAGLLGQRSTYLAMADPQHANVVGRQILKGLDGGRWSITRGAAELYREPFSEERPESCPPRSASSDEGGHGPGTRGLVGPQRPVARYLLLLDCGSRLCATHNSLFRVAPVKAIFRPSAGTDHEQQDQRPRCVKPAGTSHRA